MSTIIQRQNSAQPLEPYKHAITTLPPEAKAFLARSLLDLPRTRALYPALLTTRADQATLVLLLLHAGSSPCRKAAERLVGHPIRRCLPHVPPDPLPARVTPRSGDARRFTFVLDHNPLTEHPNNSHNRDFHRFSLFRRGRTIAEYLGRGGSRKHLRMCVRRGWVKVEGE